MALDDFKGLGADFVDAADSTLSEASSATQQLAGEVQSGLGNAFGSPHLPSAAAGSSPLPTQPPPASPLDGAAKQLDFDLGGGGALAKAVASPATPGMSPAAAAAPANGTSTPAATLGFAPPLTQPAVDYDKFVKDTLLWVNKVRSGVYLVGGLIAIYAAYRASSIKTSLVTAVSFALLAQIGLNFLRVFISPQLQERFTWTDSNWTEGAVGRASGAIRGAAQLADKHLPALEPSKTLRIVLVLWAVSLAGRVAGLFGLATLLWILAFVVPKAYTVQQAKVDQVWADVTSQIKTRFTALDARVRAAAIVVPIFVAGYALSSADLAIALLALALYGRSLLAPAQVERLQSVAGPLITNTVSKLSGTVSRLAISTANKYELTPTPIKQKRA